MPIVWYLSMSKAHSTPISGIFEEQIRETMSILDITSDNFNIAVGDVAKEIKITAYASYAGKDDIPWTECGKHQRHANHVQVIVTNRIQKYTGRDLKNTVSYHLGERGDVGNSYGYGTTYREEYKGTKAEVRFIRIDVTY